MLVASLAEYPFKASEAAMAAAIACVSAFSEEERMDNTGVISVVLPTRDVYKRQVSGRAWSGLRTGAPAATKGSNAICGGNRGTQFFIKDAKKDGIKKGLPDL